MEINSLLFSTNTVFFVKHKFH